VIEGVGPRYCPSIEDKVVRFADKTSHQIFIEPEGLATHEIYPNGISTSLPFDVQLELVRSIRGFERAHLTRPGYAIEYDYFDPRGTEAERSRPRPSPACSSPARSTAPPATKKPAAQGLLAGSTPRCGCRAASLVPAPRRGLCRRVDRRPDHPTAPPSPTACSPRAPSTACSCARTMPMHA
jgi:hypothetical protein